MKNRASKSQTSFSLSKIWGAVQDASGPAKAGPDVRRRGLRGPLRLYGFNERLLLVLEIAALLAVGGFLGLTAREIEAV